MTNFDLNARRYLNRSLEAGETLIEVLIAITLVAFSLLGIARLELIATQAQQDGLFKVRTNAIFSELSSRISANSSQVYPVVVRASSGYNFNSTWNDQASNPTAPTQDCATATCTAPQRAAFDLYEIRSITRNYLPQGGVSLNRTSQTGMVLSLFWVDKNFLNTSMSAATPGTSPTCTPSTSSSARFSCCPSAASIPGDKGIRCTNYYFAP